MRQLDSFRQEFLSCVAIKLFLYFIPFKQYIFFKFQPFHVVNKRCWCTTVTVKKVKADIHVALHGNPHLRATGRHLPYGITQCYLPPVTNERAPPNPSHTGWYSIYLPRRDGRLSWPSCPGVEPATFWSRVRRRTTAPPRHCRQLTAFSAAFVVLPEKK